jgi:hypothetical protein
MGVALKPFAQLRKGESHPHNQRQAETILQIYF